MPTESEFPADIDLTATRITRDYAAVVMYENGLHDEIAYAIFAERRRCFDLCRRVGSPEWSEDTNSGYELAAREIAEDIENGRGV